MENRDQTAINAVTTTPQSKMTFHAVTRQPRHHDVIMERNEQFEDELWARMSGQFLPVHDRSDQGFFTAPNPPGEPGPAEPNRASPNPLYQPTVADQLELQVNFLPPGHGRTPQQIAAARELRAAVSARARQQEEAERAGRAQLAAPAGHTADRGFGDGDGDGGYTKGSGPEHHSSYDLHQQPTEPHDTSTHFDASPAPIGSSPTPRSILSSPDIHAFTAPLSNINLQQTSTQGLQQPLNSGNAVQNHLGDSIFNQMMNDLIGSGRAANMVYRQVRLPSNRPTPFGREFLYYAEWVERDHWLYASAREPRSVLRMIRNARNGEFVGWQDSESRRLGGIHLLPTENRGRWVPEDGNLGEPSGGHR